MSATTFINPYNFVPVKNQVDRRAEFYRQEKFQGYSGKMVIRLTTLTRLFIPDRRQATNKQDEKKFFWREQLFDAPSKPKLDQKGRPLFHPHYTRFFENAKGDKIIPGSSLKGMLRSVAEALSDSCFGLDTDTTAGDHGEHARKKCLAPLPGQEPKAGEGLCPCCRIFGYVHASESGRKDDDEGQRNFKGRVMVYDAVLADGSKDKIKQEEYRLKELSSPKPQHRPFYFDDPNQGRIRGRKFYYHHADEPENFSTKDKTHRNCTIHESILSGAVFKFKLHFENLSREELGLLLYAIRLNGVNDQKDENFMAHKVGMAKPLGFGSVQLVIENFTLFENGAAYQKFDAPVQQVLSDVGDAAGPFNEFLQSLAGDLDDSKGFANPFQNADKAYDLWKFPRAGEVRYPENAWFKHPLGRSHALPQNGELPILSELDNAGLSDGKKTLRTPAGAAGATYSLGEHLQKPQAAPAKTAESQNPVFEVEVLKRIKSSNKVVVEIDKVKHEIACSDNRIQAGDKILVKRQKDKSYKWQPRR